MENETRAFTITTTPNLMKQVERLLALLHYNSIFGHSGLFAMSLDADGIEKISIEGIDPKLAYEVELIGGVGYDVEIARGEGYGGAFLDRQRKRRWYTAPPGTLYIDGQVKKTIPSVDRDFESALKDG